MVNDLALDRAIADKAPENVWPSGLSEVVELDSPNVVAPQLPCRKAVFVNYERESYGKCLLFWFYNLLTMVDAVEQA